jgi:hypothetical protein
LIRAAISETGAPGAKRWAAPEGNETFGSAILEQPRRRLIRSLRRRRLKDEESDMMPETQVYTIARQMFERHGLEAIALAASNALASERKGDADQAQEWRHIEDAIKMMRGPHQS